MIVIDTSALIAIFRQEPEAESFLRAIVAARPRFISALSLLEASMVMSGGARDASVFEPLDDFLQEAGIAVVPFDDHQARFARGAFLRYGKGRHKAGLNFGDCASYALAKTKDAALLFKGEDFPHTDVIRAVAAVGR